MMAAKIMLIVVLEALAAAAAVATIGLHRWAEGARELRGRLRAARLPVLPRSVDFREIEGLPAPVQAYFCAALREGQPMVAGARVRHHGTLPMSSRNE
jgi:hypothetical protein